MHNGIEQGMLFTFREVCKYMNEGLGMDYNAINWQVFRTMKVQDRASTAVYPSSLM